MISIVFSGVQWGTDAIHEQTADGPVQGRQINLLDPDSQIIVHVPFSGEALRDLIKELANGLTDTQRRQLVPEFSGIQE